jgi:pyruvate dehydrogenase E1 component
VRGNGKIIQELEGDFRGAGWNVIKLLWGGYWDPLLAQDKTGLLAQRMMEVVDGEYQTMKARDGAYVREQFFGKYPELAEAMVANWSNEDIFRLNRGGHDPHKVYAAYDAAVKHKGQPTVILAKTIKGYGMGELGRGAEHFPPAEEGRSGTIAAIKAFRDRFELPVKDEDLEKLPYLKFEEGSKELQYMRERRMALGGYLPSAPPKAEPLPVPPLSAFDALLKAGGDGRELSTTMAFVRIMNILLKRPGHRQARRAHRGRTNRAPSAWKACSARSASGTRTARTTCRRTPTR